MGVEAQDNPDLSDVLTDAWARLAAGATRRRHAFHQAVIATVDAEGQPDARTVVLRDADAELRTLVFHTDTRAPKCDAIRETGRAAWLVYDPEAKIQLRVRTRAEVLTSGPIWEARWSGSLLTSRRCYLAPNAPGADAGTDAPDPNLPEHVRDHVPTEDISAAGRSNFAVVRCVAESLDWLHLKHTGHRRARFRWSGDELVEATWVSP